MQEFVAASVVVRDAEEMSDAGRRNVAAWLREQADALEAEGIKYAPRYTASYRYFA